MSKRILIPSTLPGLIGNELGVSDWHLVTQQDVNHFADVTQDQQWIHVDTARAEQGPFGATIVHGFLTLALLPKFAREVYGIEDVRMTINYGLNRVRFPHPIRVGERVRDRLSLVAVDETKSGTQVAVRHQIEIEGGNVPACIAETVSLLKV